MRREEKKRLKKRKEREQELAARKKYFEAKDRERRRQDQYPVVEISSTKGTAEFVGLVRTALTTIDFDDPTFCDPGMREVYKLIRQEGWPYALKCLKAAMAEREEAGDKFASIGVAAFIMHFGDALLSRIPEETRRRLMPYNDVRVMFRGRKIVLEFSSMLTEKGSMGTIFFSRRRPAIEFDGKLAIVAFSRHAIERICERLNPRYLTYAAAGDVHAFFSSCVYFEPVTLHGNQPAFCLFDACHEPGFVQYDTYVRQVLGKENVDPFGGQCFYRVGYCPVVFENGFAKAKTFLYPGFSGTPEFGAVLRANLPRTQRDALIRDATNNSATEVVVNDNPATIKWFHEHGVPQVVQMKRDVFVYH